MVSPVIKVTFTQGLRSNFQIDRRYPTRPLLRRGCGQLFVGSLHIALSLPLSPFSPSL